MNTRFRSLWSVLTLLAFVLVPAVRGDELVLKDGSVIRGRILEVIPGENYRILTRDGSEHVYMQGNVQSVKFDAVTKAEHPRISRRTNSRDGSLPNTEQKMAFLSPVLSFGRYGTFGTVGLGLDIRPVDHLGLGLGVGSSWFVIEGTTTESGWREQEEVSGSAPTFAVRETLYFRDRSMKAQHALVFGQYYSMVYGPMVSLSYGWEYHFRHRFGLGLGIGVIAPVGDFEQSMIDYAKDVEHIRFDDVDFFTYVPVLFDISLLF